MHKASPRNNSPIQSAARATASGDRALQSLADLQRLMQCAITRPLTSAEGMQQIAPDGSATAELAAQFIKPNDRLSSFERLQIYNQQYWWRLLGNFGEDFRGVRAVLGQRKFDRLAVAYLEACGSMSWSLRDLGSQLEAFLRAHPHFTAPHEELALETAQVEWARVIAFDGPELPPIKPVKIARTAPDQLRLSLQPYITLLELAHPIDELLLRLKQSEIETGAVSNAVSGESPRRRPLRLSARRSNKPIFLAVHRLEHSVWFKRLEPAAFHLLRALAAGDPLEAACERAFERSRTLPEDLAGKVQEWFAQWMRLGWLCARCAAK